MTIQPLVGLPADTYENHGFLFHSIGDKYVRAVAEVAQCLPVMIPALADVVDLDSLLDHVDGIRDRDFDDLRGCRNDDLNDLHCHR